MVDVAAPTVAASAPPPRGRWSHLPMETPMENGVWHKIPLLSLGWLTLCGLVEVARLDIGGRRGWGDDCAV